MRIVFIFIVCFWVDFDFIAFAQSLPQEEHQTSSQAPTPDTKENKVTCSISAGVVQIGHEQQADNPNRKSPEESKKFWEQLPNWVVALFTIVLAIVGGLTWWTYHRILTTTRAIERAYVKMSHFTPPGLQIDHSTGRCSLVLQVKNWGQTPAEVTSVLLSHALLSTHERLPEIPDYERTGQREHMEAFLVREDEFCQPRTFTISTASVPSVSNGTTVLYVFGYVDYTDKFGTSHRAGYARIYDPQSRNLGFVTQAGYNYDRPRQKGEGHDW